MCLFIKPAPRWIRIKICGLWSNDMGIGCIKEEYITAAWGLSPCWFHSWDLRFGGNFDEWTFFVRLVTFASPIFSYLARSSSKLSFGLLLLCLSWPLPPLALRASSFSPSWQTCSKGGFLADSPCSMRSIGFCFGWRDFSYPPVSFWNCDNFVVL